MSQTEEHGGLQFKGSQRGGQDWMTEHTQGCKWSCHLSSLGFGGSVWKINI